MNARTTRILLGVILLLLLGATIATITGLVAFRFLRERNKTGPLTFANLRETDLPGRYKMSEGTTKQSFIVLYSDYTFMNEDGTIFPQYRWELSSNELSLTWQRNTTVFTNTQSVGLYLGAKENGTPLRLEKLPPYTAAQLAAPTSIAAIHFGSPCVTNGLTPVNADAGADGEIFPGNVAGVDCFRMMRKPGRGDAYLHLQIAPELKEPPFTNALVVVEFFDPAAAPGRPGRLVVHYDDERGGPYATSQPLPLPASERWAEATFYLATPLLQNRQDFGADFRLAVNRPELSILSVKLLKNVPFPETKMPALTPR